MLQLHFFSPFLTSAAVLDFSFLVDSRLMVELRSLMECRCGSCSTVAGAAAFGSGLSEWEAVCTICRSALSGGISALMVCCSVTAGCELLLTICRSARTGGVSALTACFSSTAGISAFSFTDDTTGLSVGLPALPACTAGLAVCVWLRSIGSRDSVWGVVVAGRSCTGEAVFCGSAAEVFLLFVCSISARRSAMVFLRCSSFSLRPSALAVLVCVILDVKSRTPSDTCVFPW